MFTKHSCVLLILVVTVVEKDLAVPAGSREERSDDVTPLQTVVNELAQRVTLLNAQLAQQENGFRQQLTLLYTEIKELRNKTDTLSQTVAFYAWNQVFPIHTTSQGVLIFDHAETNTGDAYDPLSGIFTAPVTGLYHFQTTFLPARMGSGQSAHAAIFVDNKMVAKGIADVNMGQFDQTTISSLVRVSAGQRVFVKNPDSLARDYFGNANEPHTTFSGFLLRAE